MGDYNSVDKPTASVTKIHESFVNANWLRYYWNTLIQELNLVPDKLGNGIGDKFIIDMFHWEKSVSLHHVILSRIIQLGTKSD